MGARLHDPALGQNDNFSIIDVHHGRHSLGNNPTKRRPNSASPNSRLRHLNRLCLHKVAGRKHGHCLPAGQGYERANLRGHNDDEYDDGTFDITKF